ncbi:MAG: RagB/SusD family nutrient uptake outer membrane protein [Bacteroidales bacterium]|nr:RagB/SusD family nutrient uptake outer membrane protein [Bacteroidales bacterium]
MNIKTYSKNLALAAICGVAACSCTDLDEKVYDRIDASIYYQNETSVKGAVAAIYAKAALSYSEYFWYLNEFSADQITWRAWNGGLWGYDEGEKTVLCTHTWTPESKILRSTWEQAWGVIAMCNNLMGDLENLDPANLGMKQEQFDSYYAEVRTLRAWAYYNNFELWGGAIPLFTTTDGSIPASASKDAGSFEEGCKVIYKFICDELDECCEALPMEDGSHRYTNRMTQAVNRILKMRLLLNANVFIGEEHFDECETLAQELVDNVYGQYSIEEDYRNIYHLGNSSNSTEVVMAFSVANGQLNTGWMRDMPFLWYTYKDYFDFESNQSSWNCTCLTPSLDNSGTVNSALGYSDGAKCFLDAPYNDKLGCPYERFNAKDIRKQNYTFENGNYQGIFLQGLMKAHFGTGETLKCDADRDKMDLYYTDQVGQFPGATAIGRELEDVMSPRWGETNSGVRLVRYPIYPASEGKDFQDIHEVEFRITEAYYTLAECKLRSGKITEAENIVLKVRNRYFENNADAKDYGRFSEIDGYWMLDQWGQEYLGEGRRRRTDLRRFDKFTQGQWWFFGRAVDDGYAYPEKRDRKYEWYPLPSSAIMVNPGLEQNPNYN